MDVPGRARGISTVCPGVGAESVPPCVYPAVSHRLYRAEDRAERLALVACLLAVIPALNLATSDAAAVAGLVMTVLTVGLVSCAGKSLPRFWPGDFFPTFYACHLAVLGVLAL